MKKRAMKKWIPKHTLYCYEHLTKVGDSWGVKYVGHCKWRQLRHYHDEEYPDIEKEWYCAYLGKFDSELGCGLLWDACKECGEHYYSKKDEERTAKWYYRNRERLKKRGIEV